MRLINYKRGYNDTFDCSIHGSIYMSMREYKKAVKYIVENKKTLDNNAGYPIFKTFCNDIQRKIEIKNGFIINVRKTVTDMIAYYFRLGGYKRGNYQLIINN